MIYFTLPVKILKEVLSGPSGLSSLASNHGKASLTSHPTCTYVLVTEKNRLICKGPSRHTYDFRTKYQGRTGLAMKIGMHIFPACTQDIYKRIRASRVTYERLVHVHSPYKCCRFSPIIYIV